MTLSNQSASKVRSTRFQWQPLIHSAELVDDWQDHLTRHLFALTTIQTSGDGPDAPTILAVELEHDPLGLYSARVQKGGVEVRVSYEAIGKAGIATLYPGKLRLKTTRGTLSATVGAPSPLSRVEWEQIIEEFWFQLTLEAQVRLTWGVSLPKNGATNAFVPQGPLLSRYHLTPSLEWVERPPDWPDEQPPPTWQRELRLIPDPDLPWLLHAQVGWRAPAASGATRLELAAPDTTKTPPAAELLEETGPLTTTQELVRWQEQRALGRPGARSQPDQNGGQPRRTGRSGLLLAGVLLLVLALIVGSLLASGFLSSKPQEAGISPDISLTSPTPGTTGAPSPTTRPGAPSPTARPGAPSPTAQPSATATLPATPTPLQATPTPAPPTATPGLTVNLTVSVWGSTNQRCSPHPNVSPLILILNNSGSSLPLTWQVTISDTDPVGNVWASATPASGTLGVGQQVQVILTPISSLCQDMAGAPAPILYRAVVSGSAVGQTTQTTVTVTVKP